MGDPEARGGPIADSRWMPVPPVLELRLALAGGVSCGSYQAGALEVLVAALDAMHGAVPAPPHRIRLAAIAGCSAGALNGALLGHALAHATLAEDRFNPFRCGWITGTDATDLLGLRDAGLDGLSLFDSTHLDRITETCLRLPGRLLATRREWVPERVPLRVVLSLPLGRLPVVAPVGVSPLLRRLEHGVRVEVGLRLQSGAPAPPREWPQTDPPALRWAHAGAPFADLLQSSGGLPLLFRVRRPEWARRPQDPLPPVSVDGGLVRDLPLDVAWEGADATRPAVLLAIDPLVQMAREPTQSLGALQALMSLAALLRTRSLEASLPEVPPGPAQGLNFLLTPAVWDDAGRLAGSFLGAFGGYLDIELREHDYALGRHQMARFLQERFTLPIDHPLFAGRSTSDLQPWLAANGEVRLIAGGPALEAPLPHWPFRRRDFKHLAGPLRARWRQVLGRLLAPRSRSWFGRWVAWALAWLLAFPLAALSRQLLIQAAAAHGLQQATRASIWRRCLWAPALLLAPAAVQWAALALKRRFDVEA